MPDRLRPLQFHEVRQYASVGHPLSAPENIRVFPQRPSKIGAHQARRDGIHANIVLAVFHRHHQLQVSRLEMQYAPRTGLPRKPPILETMMIEPSLRSIISGSTMLTSQWLDLMLT